MEGVRVSNTLKIIKVLYKLGGCATVDDLVRELGRSRKYVHAYLSILKAKSVVRTFGRLYCLSKE